MLLAYTVKVTPSLQKSSFLPSVRPALWLFAEDEKLSSQ